MRKSLTVLQKCFLLIFQDFVFYVSHVNLSIQIFALGKGNHAMYMNRRKPDTMEVKQMKAQAAEDRLAREAER